MRDCDDPVISSLTIDATEVNKELAHLQRTADLTARDIIDGTQKAFSTVVLTAEIFGMVIPRYLNLLASSVFMASRTFYALATAETMSVWLAVKAGLTFSIASLLFYQAVQISGQRDEAARQSAKIIQLISLYAGSF